MLDIPVPCRWRTQREIVAELEKQFSRLDEAVANLQRVKANLKRYKASVLKAAVEGRLVETEATLAHREGRTYETGDSRWLGLGLCGGGRAFAAWSTACTQISRRCQYAAVPPCAERV
jgi:hypothetical protein